MSVRVPTTGDFESEPSVSPFSWPGIAAGSLDNASFARRVARWPVVSGD